MDTLWGGIFSINQFYPHANMRFDELTLAQFSEAN
jgi:hypothetical protein